MEVTDGDLARMRRYAYDDTNDLNQLTGVVTAGENGLVLKVYFKEFFTATTAQWIYTGGGGGDNGGGPNPGGPSTPGGPGDQAPTTTIVPEAVPLAALPTDTSSAETWIIDDGRIVCSDEEEKRRKLRSKSYDGRRNIERGSAFFGRFYGKGSRK